MVFTVLCMLFRVFIIKRVSRILCTLVVISVIFCGLRFELFKLHGTIIFFAKTQVNPSAICNPYLQDKLVYIYEKLHLLHRGGGGRHSTAPRALPLDSPLPVESTW